MLTNFEELVKHNVLTFMIKHRFLMLTDFEELLKQNVMNHGISDLKHLFAIIISIPSKVFKMSQICYKYLVSSYQYKIKNYVQ